MQQKGPWNALEILKQDHRRLRDLFDSFDESEDFDEQRSTLKTLLDELRLHTHRESGLFHTAVKEASWIRAWVEQAEEEHQDIEALIQDFERMDIDDPRFSDKFAELEDKILQHIHTAEADLFPRAEEAGLDLDALGDSLREAKKTSKKLPA